MRRIKNIFLDVDGTLTDGKIYYSSSGEEMKSFNIKDGLIMSVFVKCGYNIVVVTGRKSNVVSKRMSELGVREVYQGITDKKIFLEEYINNNGISADEICYVGDDLNDLKAMKICKFKACPVDACHEIISIADYVSSCRAGNGAIREIFEYIAKEQCVWETIIENYE